MAQSTTFKRVTADLDQGIISEGSINALKRALVNQFRRDNGWSISVTATKITDDELQSLLDRIRKERPLITKAQELKGIVWLRNLQWTTRGQLRKNAPFTDKQALMISERGFKQFKLVDFEAVSHSHYNVMYYPVYRVESIAGTCFEYYAGSWQSGVALEIVG